MNFSLPEQYEQYNSATFFSELTTWNYAGFSIIIFCGILANVLLLFAIYRDPLRCFRNFFVSNLAVSDLLNGCIYMCEILFSLTCAWEETSQLWAEIYISLFTCIFLATFPAVFCLAVERHLAVTRPLWHRVHANRRSCSYCLIVLWLIIFAYNGLCAGLRNSSREIVHYHIAQLCFYMLFYIGTIVVYFLSFISIRQKRQGNNSITSQITRQMAEQRLKSENNFLKTIFIVNVILVFNLIPSLYYFVVHLYEDSKHIWEHTGPVVRELIYNILDTLYLGNFAITPFLYVMRLKKYRKTFLYLYWRRPSR